MDVGVCPLWAEPVLRIWLVADLQIRLASVRCLEPSQRQLLAQLRPSPPADRIDPRRRVPLRLDARGLRVRIVPGERTPMLPSALLAALLVASHASPPASQSRDLSAPVEQAMARTSAKGLAIALIDHGRVVRVQAFGLRNASGDPLTTDTVMYGASLTKAVVGYLVTQLAQEKRLELDRSFAKLLPKPLPEYGNPPAYGHWGDLKDDPRWRALTPRMVLNHSTGFANFAFLEPDEKLHIQLRARDPIRLLR